MAESVIDPKVLATEVQALIEDYPLTVPENPASWVMLNQAGKQSRKIADVCHASIVYYKRDEWDEMLTAVPHSRPNDILYLQWLIQGPFKRWKDYFQLKQALGCYYIHILGLDVVPANVLYNFVIATRMPIEQPETITHWRKLADLGLSDGLAFCIAGMTDPDLGVSGLHETMTMVGPQHAGHWWYQGCSDWNLIIAGTPLDDLITESSYKDSPAACYPADVIWGNNQNTYQLFKSSTLHELKEMFDQ